MINKIMRSFKRTYIIIISMFISLIISQHCFSESINPKGLSILASPPMSRTFITCYPTVETIYASDQEIVLIIFWGDTSKSENHTIKWEIYQKGYRIYTGSDNKITIFPNMFVHERIPLDSNIKGLFKTGEFTVKIFFDDKLSLSQNAQYSNESIININYSKVVILPFRGICTKIPKNIMGPVLDTIAGSIYCEVKRIMPYSIPTYIAEQSLEKSLKRDCFKKKECVSLIEERFGKNIFMMGEFTFPEYDNQSTDLKISIYNAKTGEIKEFYHYEFPTVADKFTDIIHGLLFGVMHKKGLLEYLKNI